MPAPKGTKAEKVKKGKAKAKEEPSSAPKGKTSPKKATKTAKSKTKSTTEDDDDDDVLRREILALGGDESDIELLEDIDESEDVEGDEDDQVDVSSFSPFFTSCRAKLTIFHTGKTHKRRTIFYKGSRLWREAGRFLRRGR
jgi:hypothetical protein